jgi:hypothetical protein
MRVRATISVYSACRRKHMKRMDDLGKTQKECFYVKIGGEYGNRCTLKG